MNKNEIKELRTRYQAGDRSVYTSLSALLEGEGYAHEGLREVRIINALGYVLYIYPTGEVKFFSPFKTAQFLRSAGLKKIRWGVVDCPPWPDSPGFRDLRLHRLGDQPRKWVSPYVDYLQSKKFPGWMKWVYLGERLPVPNLIKLPYSHLFYIIGQVSDEAN